MIECYHVKLGSFHFVRKIPSIRFQLQTTKFLSEIDTQSENVSEQNSLRFHNYFHYSQCAKKKNLLSRQEKMKIVKTTK